VPVRSLSSSVLRWPTKGEVERAVSSWAESLAEANLNVLKVGFRGSYADGTWGVGSDIDLVIILGTVNQEFFERGRYFDATDLPVPADVLVYSVDEEAADRFTRDGTVWVYERS
jgi:predicted nucleotidyltransferase